MEQDDKRRSTFGALARSPKFLELDVDCLAAGRSTIGSSAVQIKQILHLDGELHESPETLQIHCASLIALWSAMQAPSVVDLGDCSCVGRRLLLRERTVSRRFAIHAVRIESDQALFVVISSTRSWQNTELAKALVSELVDRVHSLPTRCAGHAEANVLPQRPLPMGGWYAFTGREIDILKLIASGLSNKQIAREIGSSPNTVRNQVHALFRKTGVVNRTELALRVTP